VSTTTAALRDLFGNTKTSAVGDWPARHPAANTVVWALILLSVGTAGGRHVPEATGVTSRRTS
jgi:hypothetical protein